MSFPSLLVGFLASLANITSIAAATGFPARRIFLVVALLVILGYTLRRNLNRRSKDSV